MQRSPSPATATAIEAATERSLSPLRAAAMEAAVQRSLSPAPAAGSSTRRAGQKQLQMSDFFRA